MKTSGRFAALGLLLTIAMTSLTASAPPAPAPPGAELTVTYYYMPG